MNTVHYLNLASDPPAEASEQRSLVQISTSITHNQPHRKKKNIALCVAL